MTEKQARELKRDIRAEIFDIKLTLEYSIQILGDYRGELQTEVKDLTKLIAKSNRKIKAIETKYPEMKNVKPKRQ